MTEGPAPTAPSARTAPPAPAPAVEVVDLAAHGDPVERMAREVRASLSATPPWLPCKYFYDDRGSALFDEITRLPEYYPTRTEAAILAAHVDELVGPAAPRELLELGSGSGTKTRRIVEAARRAGRLERMTFLDVHGAGLVAALSPFAAIAPEIALRGLVGDFATDLDAVAPTPARMVVFLGGTIGNLHPDREVPAFFRSVRRLLDDDGCLLLGVDLEKDVATLERAYDDARGVTAAFNRNVLRVVNHALGADFVPDDFAHVAFYDRVHRWIEMRLRATKPCRVRVPRAGVELALAPGDDVRTEISCKYTRSSLEARLAGTGLAIDRWITDARGWFAVARLRPRRGSPA
jgi:L-histidine N-alpha-methyltransferase